MQPIMIKSFLIQWNGSNEAQVAEFLRAVTPYRIVLHRNDHIWIGRPHLDEGLPVEPGDWLLRIDSLSLVQVLSPQQKAALFT